MKDFKGYKKGVNLGGWLSQCKHTYEHYDSFISESDIEKYVASGEPMGKAGSYAIQGLGSALVEGIEGDYYNIVGFPVPLFCDMLKREYGISVFDIAE